MELKKEWTKILEKNQDIFIYGAGKYGKKIFRLLIKDGKEDCVCGFLVSKRMNNPEEIETKPVILVNELRNKEALILIAVSDRYQEEIKQTLNSLDFNNVVNAYKYSFLENDEENIVDVIELKRLMQKQFDGIDFCRYDIIVRLLAVEEYYSYNEVGMSLYAKMQNERVYAGYADLAIERFKKLMKSFELNGYDADSEIVVDKNFRLIDGAHRVALAVYHNISYIKVRMINEYATNCFRLNWFEKRFEVADCKIIVDKYQQVKSNLSNDKKSKSEKIKEEIYCILGNNQDFGRGGFYQSLEELGVKGQRPTEKRIVKYELDKIVRGKRVLDIGCNCGFMDLSLRSIAQSVMGIEYNKSLIIIAEKVKKYLGCKNVYFEVADFKKWMTDNKYDVIFSFAVHYWINMSVKEYCKKVLSMLEMGGYLVFESQDIEKDNITFEKYCCEFEMNGFKKLREDTICDDGKITRRFLIYRYVI